MPTDSKALREKLDAMVKAAMPKNTEVIEWDDWHKATTTVALDLLRRLEEHEEPCVWKQFPSGKGHQPACKREERHSFWMIPAPNFCPGCGHPVVVKPKAQGDGEVG